MFLKLFPRYAGRARRGATVAGDLRARYPTTRQRIWCAAIAPESAASGRIDGYQRLSAYSKLVLGNPTKSVDRTLLRNIRNALSWLDRIKAGKTYEQIATEDAIPTDRVRKAIRYAFLAPDIVRAIVEGRQPVGLTSSYLLHHPLPDDWEKQRVLVKTL